MIWDLLCFTHHDAPRMHKQPTCHLEGSWEHLGASYGLSGALYGLVGPPRPSCMGAFGPSGKSNQTTLSPLHDSNHTSFSFNLAWRHARSRLNKYIMYIKTEREREREIERSGGAVVYHVALPALERHGPHQQHVHVRDVLVDLLRPLQRRLRRLRGEGVFLRARGASLSARTRARYVIVSLCHYIITVILSFLKLFF